MIPFYQKRILIIFTSIIYISYLLGFYFNENSIGSGGLDGDLNWMWNNFDLFKNNSLIDAINHKDFFGNRTPLLYIINIIFNPFINDIYYYRLSIFLFSLIGPICFYFCLKNKFKNIDKEILLLISSLILLSPYYRTTAYWGMEINYGIITMLISFYYLIIINENNKKISLQNILMLVFFSSLSIYFDQKLLFIPILAFVTIMLTKNNLQIKIITLILYSLLALPFIYLIIKWNGIVPPRTQELNLGTFNSLDNINLHFYHIGYATSMMALYFLPILFLFNNNFFEKIFLFLKNNFLYIACPFLVYIILFIYLDWYELAQSTLPINSRTGSTYGLGFLNKLSFIFFLDPIFRKVFIFLSFFISWVVVSFFFQKRIKNILLIFYFYFLSISISPIVQEYFDPYILLIGLLCFDLKLKIDFRMAIYTTSYVGILLVAAIFYRISL